MLRITKHVNGNTTLLKLEGALRDAWLKEVSHELSRAKEGSTVVTLDLMDVTFADNAGIAFLSQILRDGVQLAGASGFIATSLGLEKP